MAGHEFDIIQRYFTQRIRYSTDAVALGPGDDCAVLDVPADRQLCVSTDTLLEGVHFPLGASADVVAHRSLAANLSDLAAMGAAPFAFTLALTLPGENADWLDLFSATLARLTEAFAIPLVGGNLARGPLSITITVMGTVAAGGGMRRGGALPLDDVYVSGTLGDAAAGLERLLNGDEDHSLVQRYRYPAPRLALGQALASLANAAIDISDGLVADLGHICTASGIGARLVMPDIPVRPELLALYGEARRQAMMTSGGDDYELCFTAPQSARAAIAGVAQQLGLPLTAIGQMVAGPARVQVVDGAGAAIGLVSAGYEHFS